MLPGYTSFKEIVYKFDITTKITLGIHVVVGNQELSYTLILTPDNYIERVIMNNKLVLSSNGGNRIVTISRDQGSPLGISKLERSSYFTVTVYKSAIPYIKTSTQVPGYLRKLASILDSMYTFSFSPERVRGVSPISIKPVLGYHGENLARVLLHTYLEDRKTFNNYREHTQEPCTRSRGDNPAYRRHGCRDMASSQRLG